MVAATFKPVTTELQVAVGARYVRNAVLYIDSRIPMSDKDNSILKDFINQNGYIIKEKFIETEVQYPNNLIDCIIFCMKYKIDTIVIPSFFHIAETYDKLGKIAYTLIKAKIKLACAKYGGIYNPYEMDRQSYISKQYEMEKSSNPVRDILMRFPPIIYN